MEQAKIKELSLKSAEIKLGALEAGLHAQARDIPAALFRSPTSLHTSILRS